jgi:hypothetical protein
MNIESCKPIIESSETYSEMLRKMGLKITGTNYKKLKKFISDNKINTEKLLSIGEFLSKYRSVREHTLEEVLKEHSIYGRTGLKAKLYKYNIKSRKCEMCSQGEEWNGKKMSLILDHINGVSDDNRLDNLRILCPNCNATLDTHCGRNNRKEKVEKAPRSIDFHFEKNKHLRKSIRPPFKVLLDEIEDMGYVRVGKKYGVSDNAIRNWVRAYEVCN